LQSQRGKDSFAPMSRFKTILVHMAHDEGHLTRFSVALELARTREAHLIALYNATPISMPMAGRGASMGYINEATEIARERAIVVEKEVRESAEKAGVPIEWRMEEGDHLKVLARHALTVDLVIVSHAKAEEKEDRITFHTPENIVLDVGCPVLVLSHKCKPGLPGRNIMIAWKGSKESLRAVRDALPLLQKAEKVTLLTICKPEADKVPGAEVAAFLSRHDVHVEIITDVGDNSGVGETILFHARSSDADLIVMGAHGHSKLHEVIAGSVTKHVTAHMTMPVLISH